LAKTKRTPAVKLGSGGVPAIAWFEETDFDDERCRNPRFWTSRRDVVVGLAFEENNPACRVDQGQLSGARLVVCGTGGDDTGLNVYIGLHFLGFFWGPWLQEILRRILDTWTDETQHLRIGIPESYPASGPLPMSGELRFLGGQTSELRIFVGEHCFGVARGANLKQFLRHVSIRASRGIQADKTLCIAKGRRRETSKQDLPVAG